MSTRITTSMVQRNVLADLNSRREPSSRETQDEGRLGQGDHAARPTIRSTRRAGDGACATSLDGHAAVPAQRRRTRRAGRTSPSRRSTTITQTRRSAPATCSSRAAPTPLDQTARATRSPPRSSSSSRRSSRTPTRPTAAATCSAAPRPTRAPYASGADDTYQGDQAGLDPAVPGIVREIGPGVTMTINTVGRDDPRRRPGGRRRQAARRPARRRPTT